MGANSLHEVARAIPISEVACTTPWIEASASVEAAWELLAEQSAWFGVVRDSNTVIGYVAVDDYQEGETAGECALPISADMMLPASMPLVDAIPLFREHYFFFLLRANIITEVISFQDVDGLHGRLVLMSLLLEFEDELNKLLAQRSGEFLTFLSPDRRAKASALCDKRYGKRGYGLLLRCLMLADKTKMLVRASATVSHGPFKDHAELRSFLYLAERVRNEIAHSGAIREVLPDPVALDSFIVRLQDTTRWLDSLKLHPSFRTRPIIL